MSRPGRKQDDPKGETEEANSLARWLRRVSGNVTLRTLAERHGGGRQLWSEYRSGAKLIPAHRLEQVVREAITEPRLRAKELETGLDLLARAEGAAQGRIAGRPVARSSDHRPVQELHRRLADALEGQLTAERTLRNAEQIVRMLLGMIAWLQGQITVLTAERERALHSTRPELAQHADTRLGRAEGQLTETEEELARARRERRDAEDVTVAARRNTEAYRRALAEYNERIPPRQEDQAWPAPAAAERPGESLEDYGMVLDRIRSALDDQHEHLTGLRERVGLGSGTDGEGQPRQAISGQAEVVRVVRADNTDTPVVVSGEGSPHTFHLPRRNHLFTGRRAVLEELHRTLSGQRRDGARVALNGPSGVGKTQIALEYAHRFASEFDVVWWVNAHQRTTAREHLASIATALGFEDSAQHLGWLIQVAKQALGSGVPHRRWLLVFDGADDVAGIEDLLPHGDGDILLTTLAQDSSARGFQQVAVDAFTRSEAVTYTLLRAPRLSEMEAQELAETVERLPLLLSQTTAYLALHPGLSAADYIARIRGDLNSPSVDSDYPQMFETTWAMTAHSLRKRSTLGYELLLLFTLFSPHAVPVRLIQTAHHADLPPRLAQLAQDLRGWNRVVGQLAVSSALNLDQEDFGEDGAGPECRTAAMHRLYHRFIVGMLEPHERAHLSDVACRILAGADPRHPASPDAWKRYDELVPHLEYAGALSSTEPAVQRLVANCARYLHLSGDERTAEHLLGGATPPSSQR